MISHGMIKNTKTKLYKFANNDTIQATVFFKCSMRKGSYYYIKQTSNIGTRFLLYASSMVHHSSCALGFEMRKPEISEQLISMKKELHIIMEKMLVFDIFDNIKNSTEYKKNLIDIENTNLYFL